MKTILTLYIHKNEHLQWEKKLVARVGRSISELQKRKNTGLLQY